MATRPLAFCVGLAAAAAEHARELPERLREVPPGALRLAGRYRAWYEEMADRGRQVLHGPDGLGKASLPVEPATVGARNPAVESVDGFGGVQVPVEPGPERVPPGTTAGAVLRHDELPLEDYDHLTLPQLRGRIRRLDLVALTQLRDYEHAHADRLPVLTMLDNRMATLSAV